MIIDNGTLETTVTSTDNFAIIAVRKMLQKGAVRSFGQAAVMRQKVKENEYNTQIKLLAEQAHTNMEQIISSIEDSMKGKWSKAVKIGVKTKAKKFLDIPMGK